MKFIITHNGQETQASLDSPNHTVMFLMSYKRRGGQSMGEVHLRGTDSEATTDYQWLSKELLPGEQFELAVQTSEGHAASGATVKSTKRQDDADQVKLRAYYELKKELEQEGLL